MTRTTKAFNVRLHTSERAMLEQLARDSGLNASTIIRELIINRWKMIHSNQPACADGDGCCMVTLWLQNKTARDAIGQREIPTTQPTPLPKPPYRDVG